MSIPGLGIAPASATAPTSAASTITAPARTYSLQPFWEYRFEVPFSSTLTVRLVSGTAEKDGTELAPGSVYSFSGTKSKINTWHGCELEVAATAGSYDDYVSEPSADETPMVSYLNLHFKLEALRIAANSVGQMGPRVLVVGPPNAGKTSLARMLTAWATRSGRQPMAVNADSRGEGLLAIPGTLSAAVFASLMDIEKEWGSAPSSGPAAVPVKLPLVYYYGLAQPEDQPRLLKILLSRLSVGATARLAEDVDVKASGMIIDSPAIAQGVKGTVGYDILAHIVAEFSVNIVVVLGSERMNNELTRRFAGQTTTLGEPITVVGLEKSGGVVERDAAFLQGVREREIREYFFGDAKRTLSPFTQLVDFTEVNIWKVQEGSGEEDPYSDLVERAEPSVMMLNCTLAVMNTKPTAGPDAIRDANVMGFVYVADIDEKRHKVKILAPVNASLRDRPLLWGSWPEPMVSLVG